MTGMNESQNQYDLNVNQSLQNSFHTTDNEKHTQNEFLNHALVCNLSPESPNNKSCKCDQCNNRTYGESQVKDRIKTNHLIKESQNLGDHVQYDVNVNKSMQNSYHTTDNGKPQQNECLYHAPVPHLNPEVPCHNLCKCDRCEDGTHDESQVKDQIDNNNDNWSKYNEEIVTIINPIHEQLLNEDITPTEAATQFNHILSTFLETKPEVIKEVKEYFKHNPKTNKEIKEAKKLKTNLGKKARQKEATIEDKELACEALRHYDFLLKEQKLKAEADEIKKQERDYRRNFHNLQNRQQMVHIINQK